MGTTPIFRSGSIETLAPRWRNLTIIGIALSGSEYIEAVSGIVRKEGSRNNKKDGVNV